MNLAVLMQMCFLKMVFMSIIQYLYHEAIKSATKIYLSAESMALVCE